MSSVVLSPPPGASSWQKVDGKWKTVVCQVKPVAVPGRPDRDLDFEVSTMVFFTRIKGIGAYNKWSNIYIQDTKLTGQKYFKNDYLSKFYCFRPRLYLLIFCFRNIPPR